MILLKHYSYSQIFWKCFSLMYDAKQYDNIYTKRSFDTTMISETEMNLNRDTSVRNARIDISGMNSRHT